MPSKIPAQLNEPTSGFWPKSEEWDALLELRSGARLTGALEAGLETPIEDFLARSGKRFRSQLVELGYLVASGKSAASEARSASVCAMTADLIESIHAGALIVDDIQDGSAVRRGLPSLHVKYGVPVALNAGNWLYFYSLMQIPKLGLPPECEIEVHREVASVLMRAHCGQAIDVGTRVDEIEQGKVLPICLASIELKTGALMALAIKLGARVGGASEESLRVLDRFGHALGSVLQIHDDIGNFSAVWRTTRSLKHLEDLYLRRPSWVWAFAAAFHDAREYGHFKDAVARLPNESFLLPWLDIHHFDERMRSEAKRFSDALLAPLWEELATTGEEPLAMARSLLSVIEKSYE